MSDRKLILYISMSLDGFIATKEDDISWLSVVERTGEDYGYADFIQETDTYIVGRKTYDTVLKLTGGLFPPAEHFTCYVITRRKEERQNGIIFYNGKIETLISELKKQKGKHIYCDGGGQIVELLMQKQLIDEYIISIIPVFLGDGKRLFKGNVPGQQIKLISCKHFDSGLVQLKYEKI